MSKNQHLSLDSCYEKGYSPFRAVLMCAQESRFINEQSNLGFIQLEQKPTTIAVQKFKDSRLQVVEEKDDEGLDDLTDFDSLDAELGG